MAAIMGDVVHDCLEAVVSALVTNDVDSVADDSAVAVLRSLGGYPVVIRNALDEQFRRLEGNPRCSGRIEQLRRDLDRRIPEIRGAVQAVLVRSSLVIRRGTDGVREDRESTWAGAGQPRVMADGSYPELSLFSSELGMSGRLDLVSLKGSEVHIVDYKSGKQRSHHAEQMRTYALIWWLRDNCDPNRPYATKLTLSYANHDVDVESPTPEELVVLGEETRTQINDVKRVLGHEEPPARPDDETCRFCAVRHLCDPYWNHISGKPLKAGVSDFRGEVVNVIGPKSWLLREDGGQQIVLRHADDTSSYEMGARVRVVGAVVTLGDDDDDCVASVVVSSEVFIER